jgi:hypothetical protein
LPDKHKARGAVCGDQLAAKILKAGLSMPQTFSLTVKPLTFAFMMQIAIAMGLIWCTADIKAAYLNVPRPGGEIPILTKLEPFVAEICELDPNQLYRIDKCLYGLPGSGRHFYRYYVRRRTHRRRVRHEQHGQLLVLQDHHRGGNHLRCPVCRRHASANLTSTISW